MPRAPLSASSVEAPLTVTAVSMRLGVSPSTIRTWERRYGLGPQERQAGSHRRYRPGDIARLSRMVALVRQGVSPADAAASIIATAPTITAEQSVPRCSKDLIEAASTCAIPRLVDALNAAISAHGLIYSWSRIISPALDSLHGANAGHLPGRSPATKLTAAVLEILESLAARCPDADSQSPSVLVLTDVAHELVAHVIGVALRWYGLDVRILMTDCIDSDAGADRFERHIADNEVDLAIIMGIGASCERFTSVITREFDREVMLVGADTPIVIDGHVTRVRTPAACVEETLALLAPAALVAEAGAR
ncbi:MerR family transcriptional regulator [Actinomyces mediterranea]|uniref:MerR family transcriptional regulator n=1 Tax=Actinomyces mediterranea TaxID=1871028 RepID=UPI000970405F|nr:MerR family transcriptional regulator [Actinomyces mediterranea]